jgi:tetratricopeptide (TPR) repeat protein
MGRYVIMNTEKQTLSDGFQRLYRDATVFEGFSAFHPISFSRVLPFQAEDLVVDDERLIGAEEAHLADRNDMTRREVIEAYSRCGLLAKEDAANLISVVDYFGADFFELMGEVYANAGMFICALRWYREYIAELETKCPDSNLDNQSVYAGVGYCLYALGLFPEAMAWSKSCIGPRPTADAVCEALIDYEAQLAGGRIVGIERVGFRTRYTVSAFDPAQASQSGSRLIVAMREVAPFEEIYIDWVSSEAPAPEIKPGGYPFKVEVDATDLPRHKMNLLFATCGQVDALIEMGYTAEAKRLLFEAAVLESEAGFIQDRIKELN